MRGPDLVVPGAGILRLIYTLAGTTNAVNVFGVVAGSLTFNQSTANTLDSAIKASFDSTIGIHLHPSTSLQAIGLRSVAAPHQAEYIGSGSAHIGTGTGDRLPGGVAFVVTLRTALSGARYRGRVYLPGFSEGENDPDGTASSAVTTSAVNFVAAIQASLVSNGGNLGVLSRPAYAKSYEVTSTVPGGTNETEIRTTEARGGAITPVTAVLARNDIWDSQRRRAAAGSVSTLFRQPLAASYSE